MNRYILRRLLQLIPTVLIITIAVFWMLKLAPGDPLDLLLAGNPDMSPEQVAHMKKLYGFDRPIYEQYGRWLLQIAQGNLGFSRIYHRPITSILPDRLWNTLLLTGSSLILSLLVAIPVGIYTALRQYSILDYLFSFLAFFGIAMPIFWFALILILIFSLRLGWLPPGGHYSLEHEVGFLTVIRYMIMPVIVLSLFSMASWMRYMRSGMLEVINEDYVRTARAKGLAEKWVAARHALKNALIPMVTLIALSIPGLISGAVLTETIFSWPGMGRLIYDSLINNDFNMAMAVFLIFALLVALFNLIADLLYAVIDPRVVYE
ncbi:ABC transporter permease [Chloroflexi bacterium TSY]|nr:ABC transporter permease [Chloroflexi bacterium TSY]